MHAMVKKTVEKCDKPADTKRRRSPRSLSEIVKKEDIVKDYDASAEKREEHDRYMADYRNCLTEISEMSLQIQDEYARKEFVRDYVKLTVGSGFQYAPGKAFSQMQMRIKRLAPRPKSDILEVFVKDLSALEIFSSSVSKRDR